MCLSPDGNPGSGPGRFGFLLNVLVLVCLHVTAARRPHGLAWRCSGSLGQPPTADHGGVAGLHGDGEGGQIIGLFPDLDVEPVSGAAPVPRIAHRWSQAGSGRRHRRPLAGRRDCSERRKAMEDPAPKGSYRSSKTCSLKPASSLPAAKVPSVGIRHGRVSHF